MPPAGYVIRPPTEGFDEFELYRYAFDDERVEIHIGKGSALKSYEVSRDELKVWLKVVGWILVDKSVDWLWNYRRLHFDLINQRMSVPRDQSNPLESKGPLRFLKALFHN